MSVLCRVIYILWNNCVKNMKLCRMSKYFFYLEYVICMVLLFCIIFVSKVIEMFL